MTSLDQETRSDTGPATRAAATAATRTAFRTCPLCEAGCGLEITVVEDRVTRIRGDRDDVFSRGFICPKGSTLKQLHEDPDRVRTPLIKRDGVFQPATWDEAFTEIDRRLSAIVDRHGRQSSAAYLGNPGAHSLSPLLYGRPFLKALGTTNIYSASTVDQRPKEVSAALMFGGFFIPVPDVDRTDFLLVLGANPYASNGSLATAPDWPGRIESMRARGGKLVVVDPRRSRTAAEADEWIAIRPGTDPYLLAAMVRTIVDDGLVDLGTVAEYVTGYDDMVAALAPYDADSVAGLTGIDADTIRRLALELVASPTAAVYGRIGTTTAEFGTIASWLVDVLNIVSGNLDRPGGAMFATPATGGSSTRGKPRAGKDLRLGSRRSRVRGLGATLGEFPAVCLAEEIETPGDGQIRALFTIAGNPVLSLPNGARLDTALEQLELMVSIDIYVNETTRHADVILPAPSVLQKQHYDVALMQLGLRNVANWSEPVFPLDDDELDEWQILAKLALIAQGMGADADPAVVDDLMIRSMVDGAVADEHGPLFGRDPDDVLAALAPRTGPARIVDFMLRSGPYGDAFGDAPAGSGQCPNGHGVTLDSLVASPHGVDFGALVPRLPDGLRTASGMVELAPEPILADLPRMAARVDRPVDGYVLIGRRDLRSNNSWMHNLEILVKGKPRCTLQVHPDDADSLGLTDGGDAVVRSRVGEVTIPVETTRGIARGVVSIPHGWGHDRPGARLGVAARYAGVNSNLLADDHLIDELSGTAVLNGIPVTVSPE
jgi:anaerobic selenocysteine-containing dehydrogenase